MQRSKFDDVCDAVVTIRMEMDDALPLLQSMEQYREKYSRSFNDLMRVPGFRKLWTALEESAATSVGDVSLLPPRLQAIIRKALGEDAELMDDEQ